MITYDEMSYLYFRVLQYRYTKHLRITEGMQMCQKDAVYKGQTRRYRIIFSRRRCREL